MKINLKRVRTKCNVKGCRNSAAKVATYNISASKEFGASVIMCEECIKGAYETLLAAEGAEETTPPSSQSEPTSPYTGEALKGAEEASPTAPLTQGSQEEGKGETSPQEAALEGEGEITPALKGADEKKKRSAKSKKVTQ